MIDEYRFRSDFDNLYLGIDKWTPPEVGMSIYKELLDLFF